MGMADIARLTARMRLRSKILDQASLGETWSWEVEQDMHPTSCIQL